MAQEVRPLNQHCLAIYDLTTNEPVNDFAYILRVCSAGFTDVKGKPFRFLSGDRVRQDTGFRQNIGTVLGIPMLADPVNGQTFWVQFDDDTCEIVPHYYLKKAK